MRHQNAGHKRVLLLLPQGSEALEAAAFIDVFGWHQVLGKNTFNVVTCSARETVELSFGQAMLAQTLPQDIKATDYAALALPGGFGRYGYYAEACREPYLSLIRDFHAQEKPIAAVCTGAVVLAQAGILAGRRATTYGREPGWREQLTALGAIFEDTPLVQDGHIITSQNPASAVPVALTLLQMLAGPEEREYIQREMGF